MAGRVPQPSDAGRYDLIRPIARGGMGEVWFAVQRGAAGFEREVVVKRVLDHLDPDPEFRARFVDEARIAARLRHANIVAVTDLGEDVDGGLYLAMEWVDGLDLRRVLKTLRAEGERLPDELCVYVAAELAAGLAYAHGATDADGRALGIVHRDVSPSNVLVSRAGEIKLTDFGIASARERLGRTATGQLRGKFSYMSPEQAAGRAIDARSDVFALGALLFEMLTGDKAFDGATDLETLDLVRNGARPPIRAARPDIDPALAAVVERALALDVGARFESADALEHALRDVLAAQWPACDRRAMRRWVQARLREDPVLRAQDQIGGASLDDILNAQLDGGQGSAPSVTPSRRVVVSSSGSGRLPIQASTSGTATSALRPGWEPPKPPSRGRRAVLFGAVLLLVAGAFAFALWSPPPVLVVETTPVGAQVFLDGVPVGVSSLRMDGRAGEHEVQVRHAGYLDVVERVTLNRGETTELAFALEAADRPVAFHSVPAGALVTVGDAQVPAGNAIRVPVGRPVRVRMELDGYAPFDDEVVFDASATVFTRPLRPLVAQAPTPSAEPVEAEAAEAAPTPPRSEGDASRDARREPRRPPRPASDEPATDEAAAPDATGFVTVRFVDPPRVGEVTVDGRSHGSNDDVQMRIELPVGRHELAVRNAAAGAEFQTSVDVVDGASLTVPVVW